MEYPVSDLKVSPNFVANILKQFKDSLKPLFNRHAN